jgi:16S rRNA (guanine966-N2)-methyltransferase
MYNSKMGLKYDSPKKLRKEKNKWKVRSVEEFEEREAELKKEFYKRKEPNIKGNVRITAGEVKNFQIDIPRRTRPLTDRMKTRIFDILREDIANVTILDLYAGSGSFGFEALSRGAKHATLVDAAKHAEKILHDNARVTGYLTETTIVKEKVEDFLKKAVKDNEKYEIVFIDPPYKLYSKRKDKKVKKILTFSRDLLPGHSDPQTKLFKGAIIVKHPNEYKLDKIVKEIDGIRALETYRFGRNQITFIILDLENTE